MISPFLKQCFVVLGAATSLMGHGAGFGYTATLVAHYTDDQGNKMSNEDLSWIGSIFGISKICGCFLTPFTMSLFGRQKTHLITVLPMLLNWLLFVFGRSFSIFITARLLFGLSAGMYACMNNMMIAEYTDPVNRGAFASVSSLAVGFGIIWIHVWGTMVSWRATAAITTAIPVATAIITWFSPETPSWLVSKQRYEEARKVFTWLRGDGPRQRKEIEDLIESDKLKNETSTNLSKTESKTFLTKLRMIKKNVLIREFYQPIFICILIAIMFEFIGAHYVAAYGHVILKSLLSKNDLKDVSWHLNYLDILKPVVNTMALFILKKIKRRTILFTSVSMSLFSQLLLSAYVYTRNAYGFDQTRLLGIFVMSLMTLYIVSFNLGLSPLVYVFFGEMIPLQHRGIGSAIVTFSLSSLSFTVLKTCPQIYSSMGVEGSFLVFSVIISVCLVILYYILPETKDRTLLDIESEFKNKPKDEKPVQEVEVRLMVTKHDDVTGDIKA